MLKTRTALERRLRGVAGCGLMLLGVCCTARAQGSAQAPVQLTTTPDVVNMDQLKAQAPALLEKAKSGSGSAGLTLAQYNGHYTMLTARTKSGGAEVHKNFADFLIVLDGEGTEMTGGTVVDLKENGNGELRGSRLEGATPHVLHAGDVIHIPAGTPHQAIEAEGQHITIYVIKVQEPATASTGAQPTTAR